MREDCSRKKSYKFNTNRVVAQKSSTQHKITNQTASKQQIIKMRKLNFIISKKQTYLIKYPHSQKDILAIFHFLSLIVTNRSPRVPWFLSFQIKNSTCWSSSKQLSSRSLNRFDLMLRKKSTNKCSCPSSSNQFKTSKESHAPKAKSSRLTSGKKSTLSLKILSKLV